MPLDGQEGPGNASGPHRIDAAGVIGALLPALKVPTQHSKQPETRDTDGAVAITLMSIGSCAVVGDEIAYFYVRAWRARVRAVDVRSRRHLHRTCRGAGLSKADRP